jgi:AAA domain
VNDDYDRLDRESVKQEIRDWTQVWAKLKPLGDAPVVVLGRIDAFCVEKRITREALEALGTRIAFRRGGSAWLAYAGRNGNSTITAIKYRPLGGSSHESVSEKPSVWLRPIIVGKLDALEWFVAEGETEAARLKDLVGGIATVLCLPTGARADFRAEWAALIPRGATVYLAEDADTDGDEHAAKAAHVIGGRTVRVRPPDGAKDWCAWDGDRDQFIALVREARERARVERELTVVTTTAFAAIDEPGASSVLGDPDAPLVAEGNNVVVYGDGGSGKTTLTVDLGYHAAAGDDWLSVLVPSARRVLLLENEGPRPLFRRKLARKERCWEGSPIDGRLFVLEEPWARFNFADPEWRQALADVIAELEVDVAIIGPITACGMDAPGTIQEVRAFIALVDDLRARSARAELAIVLIHHENRAGKPSGAWEGATDVLLHVTAQGHGKLRLYVQKARWSSQMHQTALQLSWADGDSFVLDEAGEPNRPERVWNNIAEYVLAHGGCSWNEVDAHVGGTATYKRHRRTAMLEEGVLINAAGRGGFVLWHHDDPARPALDSEVRRRSDAPTDAPASATGDGGGSRGASVRRRLKDDAPTDAPASASPDEVDSDDLEGDR